MGTHYVKKILGESIMILHKAVILVLCSVTLMQKGDNV